MTLGVSCRWLLAVVVLAGVGLRLAIPYVIGRGGGEVSLPDEAGYLELGQNLLAGNGLYWTDTRFDPPEGRRVYASRLPGYPAFVAMCGGEARVVRIVQAVLDGLTALAAFFIANRFKGPLAGVAAAAMVMLNPFMAYFSTLVLSETLFAFMLTAGLAGCLGGTDRRRRMGQITLALSVLVRPSAILLPTLLSGVTGATQANYDRGASGLRGLMAGAILTAIVLFPWAIRNRIHPQIRQWMLTSTNAGFVRYDGFNARASGASDQWFVAELPELQSMGEVAQSRYLSGLASLWIRQNPIESMELAWAKVARTWSPMPLSDEYGSPAHRTIGLLFGVPFLTLAVLGFVFGRLPWRVKLLLVTPAIYFTLVHAVSVGSLRYRVPIEPALAVLAASAVVDLPRFRSD